MLLVDSTMDDAPFCARAGGEPRQEVLDGGAAAPAELADLLALLREDVRLGVGQLAHELGRLAGDAGSLERAVSSLDQAGHTLAVHAAEQVAALPRVGLLRRLLDRHVAAVEAALDAGSDAGAIARAAAEARQSSRLLADTVAEVEAAFAPQPAHTEALATVVEVGALRLGIERGIDQRIAERMEGVRRRLERFEARLLLALRLSGAPDRRREPRLPVRLPVELRCGDHRWTGETVDLARGGALVAVATSFERPRIGGCAQLQLGGLGTFAARIVGLSARGVHLAFDRPTPDLRAVLDRHLAAVTALDAPFFQLARWAALEVEASFARGVAAGAISEAVLFASPAVLLLDSTDPAADDSGTAPALAARDFLARRLGPLQAQIAASRPELVYAACTDRHGYLPVVTAGPAATAGSAAAAEEPLLLLAMSGCLDESYDGMLAARTRQERLAPLSVRGGYEIAIPITCQGRHWGAFRIGFRRPGE
jgi:methyl-accepting chemotaxis protein